MTIRYFVGPGTARRSPEVKFPVKFPRPTLETFDQELPFLPPDPPPRAQTGPTIFQLLGYVVGFLWIYWMVTTPWYFSPPWCFVGPAPSPEIVPAPPYHLGQSISGLGVDRERHYWIYSGPAIGWIDP